MRCVNIYKKTTFKNLGFSFFFFHLCWQETLKFLKTISVYEYKLVCVFRKNC